ncbi:c-type cytochrome [Burkholderia sola]|uniref:c-type cytochrome n=1 Tax=Burkholderia TaxID=32008 RepID=UPI001AE77777|nr:c-type cytochrome [Burkholderia sp. AcTa6-5]MBP0713539.1 c-type cytochrome [Burkholderia sp. AcTa6-5]
MVRLARGTNRPTGGAWRRALCAGLLACVAQAAAAGDGDHLVKDCMSCHDAAQGRDWAIPVILGQKPRYLASRLEAFRHPDADGNLMPRLMSAFTPQEIERLAVYLSSQPSGLARSADARAVASAAGFARYQQHCAVCHEQAPDSPLLLGQGRAYLVDALRDFVYGRRGMPQGMRESLSALSADDLNAVIGFLASSSNRKEK